MEKYNSFRSFFENAGLQVRQEFETAVHVDENIANNRLFVWHFEEADLEEFLEYFKMYKESNMRDASKIKLSSHLNSKMSEMIREGYNPVECMLYASKVINMELQYNIELQDRLAECIRSVYLKQETETIAVLKNIIEMWSWIPQVKVVISAIGLIGDNQELLDKILFYYGEDPNYKTKVFYAFMQNKSVENLERVLKIIMDLQECEEDNILGKVFIKQISGFGYEGSKLIKKYYDNPGISKVGSKVLKKIMFQDNTIAATEKDASWARNMLANNSLKDDLAYQEFVADCQEKYDDNAMYLCRFSRPDIGDFLKNAIEDEKLNQKNRNTAIISMGIVGYKGYAQAASVLKTCEDREENEYAVIVAKILLNEKEYAGKLVDIFCRKMEYELSELYGLLKSANVISYNYAVNLISASFENKWKALLREENDSHMNELNCLASNFQIFWDKHLYAFLSQNILGEICNLLMGYARNSVIFPSGIVISLIETIVHSWNRDVETTMFALYKNAVDEKVQEVSFKKLKERKIEAPR